MTDWDEVYAEVITATGWTWEYLDEFVTLPRLNAITRHWLKFPPVHITAALFAGIENKAPASGGAVLDNASLVRDMHADPRKLQWVSKSNG